MVSTSSDAQLCCLKAFANSNTMRWILEFTTIFFQHIKCAMYYKQLDALLFATFLITEKLYYVKVKTIAFFWSFWKKIKNAIIKFFISKQKLWHIKIKSHLQLLLLSIGNLLSLLFLYLYNFMVKMRVIFRCIVKECMNSYNCCRKYSIFFLNTYFTHKTFDKKYALYLHKYLSDLVILV